MNDENGVEDSTAFIREQRTKGNLRTWWIKQQIDERQEEEEDEAAQRRLRHQFFSKSNAFRLKIAASRRFSISAHFVMSAFCLDY